MNIENADKIRLDWGKFLEVANGPLVVLFMGKIPKSLLPHPREQIAEALNICINHFSEIGDLEVVEIFKSTIPVLDMYIDDMDAIYGTVNRFKDESYVKTVVKALHKRQSE